MVASVIVDISSSEIDKIFDYEIPLELGLRCGERVLVPFANKTIEGFCIEIKEKSDYPNLKSVIKILDEFVAISDEMISLMKYLKEKFFIRYVDSLRLFIPNKLRGGKVKELVKEYLMLKEGITLDKAKEIVGIRAKSQIAILEVIKDGAEGLAELSSTFSPSAIKALIDKNVCIKVGSGIKRTPFENLLGQRKNVLLTLVQTEALDKIFNCQNRVSLLFGVTGSGKTEVYLNSIEKVLSEGKTAIMLVPEISLTPQILRIFRGRFGEKVAMLHSGLSDGERFDEWRRLLEGEASIAVGARSAIFAPLKNVGIIIIDEEHDTSYVSESNPRYQTVDVAKFRADFNNARLILGSATPSIDSYRLAECGDYQLVTMGERTNNMAMPTIEVVDMAEELRSGNIGIFSRSLTNEITKSLDTGGQVMLLINRRGYASFVMCKECGYIAKCSDCDVSLTYHQEDSSIKCHYCGKKYKMITNCPQCKSDKLKYGKVGTEKIVEEIHKFLPTARILRMDNDTTRKKTAYLDILSAFANREADILVGTQMIAKGHDFPDVTLVGILDADMSLYFSDFRSGEKTFQLITQVAGRAGRAKRAGKVILQTYSPKHYVFRYAKGYDYVGFYGKESNTREVTKFPPFTKLARILVAGCSESEVVEVTKEILIKAKALREQKSECFAFLQAMKAPVTRVQNRFRYQIVARLTGDEEEILKKFNAYIDECKRKDVWVFLEINPQRLS